MIDSQQTIVTHIYDIVSFLEKRKFRVTHNILIRPGSVCTELVFVNYLLVRLWKFCHIGTIENFQHGLPLDGRAEWSQVLLIPSPLIP